MGKEPASGTQGSHIYQLCICISSDFVTPDVPREETVGHTGVAIFNKIWGSGIYDLFIMRSL